MEQFFRQFEASYEALNMIEISRSAFLHNFDLLKKKYKVEHIIPVLKSNAYGHGLENILNILDDREVPYVAVDGYNEALEVRAFGDVDVLVMATILPENFSKIETKRTAYVIQDMSVLNVMTNIRRAIKIHLEFNTGLNRQGFESSELKSIIPLLKDNPQIELDGVMTHLYDASSSKRASIKAQVEEFDKIVSRLKKAGLKPRYVHISKTAGIDVKSQHVNTIRPGAGLYGINPFLTCGKEALIKKFADLRPVLSLKSSVVKIRNIEQGEGVGYGHAYVAKRSIKTAVIPLGYYEGLPVALAGEATLSYKNQPLSIIGRIAMNHTILDVTSSNIKMWDKVEVISRNPEAPNSLASWWQDFGLYPLEVLSKLSPNIRRKISD
jgi:alanine racemase